MSEHICGVSGITFATKDTTEKVGNLMVSRLLAAHNKMEDQLTELREELDELKTSYRGQFQEIAALEDSRDQLKKELAEEIAMRKDLRDYCLERLGSPMYHAKSKEQKIKEEVRINQINAGDLFECPSCRKVLKLEVKLLA